jgi:hypothetical protein
MRRFLSEADRERFPRGFQEIKRLPRDQETSKRFIQEIHERFRRDSHDSAN